MQLSACVEYKREILVSLDAAAVEAKFMELCVPACVRERSGPLYTGRASPARKVIFEQKADHVYLSVIDRICAILYKGLYFKKRT